MLIIFSVKRSSIYFIFSQRLQLCSHIYYTILYHLQSTYYDISIMHRIVNRKHCWINIIIKGEKCRMNKRTSVYYSLFMNLMIILQLKIIFIFATENKRQLKNVKMSLPIVVLYLTFTLICSLQYSQKLVAIGIHNFVT